MDDFKKATAPDFTAWDLNVPSIYKPHNRKRAKQEFKRKARRKEKQNFATIFQNALDNDPEACYNNDRNEENDNS